MLPKLTKLELRIMETLWSRGASSVRELHEAFPADKRPAFTTVQTIVYRLEVKKALRRVKRISNANIFDAVVSRTAAQNRLVDELLSLFGGRSKPVLSRLIESGKLTLDDIKEAEQALRRLDQKGQAMTPAFAAALSDHLWQSTLVVAAVGLLTLLLRRNRAQVRYLLWLVASLKFLVPFAWLEAVGQRFQRESAAAAAPQGLLQAIETVSQPFASLELTEPASMVATSSWASMVLPALTVVWLGGCVLHLVAWRRRWCAIAALAGQASTAADGRAIAILRRLESGRTRGPLAIVVSPVSVEPAVFGMWQPVLLWPRGLEDRLGDAHLEALLTHELCHVRRRDNLGMALHMLVEAVFWFHPLVWWVERRLIDERERACDEDVVRSGCNPRVYAEGILKTSELCLESPLASAAGITGSDLKRRVEAIMQRHPCLALGGWRQLLLWSAAGIALAIPFSLGVFDVPLLRAQAPVTDQGPAFEVASVKPHKSDEFPASFGLRPEGSWSSSTTRCSA